jgi:hypothetical protein
VEIASDGGLSDPGNDPYVRESGGRRMETRQPPAKVSPGRVFILESSTTAC